MRPIVEDASKARELPLLGPPVTPFQAGASSELVSRDRSIAYSVLGLPDDNDKLGDWG